MMDRPLALQLLYQLSLRRMGRRRLAETVGRTEMIVRQAVDELRDAGLVLADRQGLRVADCALESHAHLFRGIRSIVHIVLQVLGPDTPFLAAHLASTPLQPVWALRDVVLTHGGDGLILLTYSECEWRFAHNGETFREKNPADARTVCAAVADPTDGDALAAVSASESWRAAASLWALIAEVLETDSSGGVGSQSLLGGI